MARIIAVVIFGGFGMVLLYVGITQLVMQRRLLANARRVDPVIVHSEVFSSTSADTDRGPNRSTSTTTHRPDVRFRYQVRGVEYESDLLHPIPSCERTRRATRRRRRWRRSRCMRRCGRTA